MTVFRARSEAEREAIVDGLLSDFLPDFFQRLDDFLGSRAGEGEEFRYVAGGKNMTYADLAVFHAARSFSDPEDPFYSTLPGLGSRMDAINHYPKIKELVKKVGEREGVKKWIETRPKGLF